jgi:5'-phosphate synthase pdxT subunit
LDGLVIPGGESTAIANLMRIHGLYEPIIAAYAQGKGLALLGTCAGAIMLARKAQGARTDQRLLAVLDVEIARNAYGRQRDSFETTVPFDGVADGEVRGIFIRAPRFTALGANVEVLSCSPEGEALAVRQDRILALAFHPELTTDTRVHRYFLEQVIGSQ